MNIVRVQLQKADGNTVTLAQLEEPHARQYIEDISSDNFDAGMMRAINEDRTPLQETANKVRELKSNIDNALFNEDNPFRIVPCWKEGDLN